MALALLFTAGQIASFAHLALIQHSRCAEHGELIDVHGQGTQSAAIVPSGASDAQIAEAPAEASHRHEHCAATPQRREQSVAAAQRTVLAWVQPEEQRPAHSGHLLARGATALYRLAPKTSPPA